MAVTVQRAISSPPVRGIQLRQLRGIPSRAAYYPRKFMLRHPLRAARNLIGNHPSGFANKYLAGLRGVELGGASYNRFFLDTVNADYSATADTVAMQLEYAGHVIAVDVVAEAWDLPLDDDSFDFVLASHVLEHIPDPIAALNEWARVASRYVFIILPLRDYQPYDRERELTTDEELLERHEQGPRVEEWRGHWSRWTSTSFSALCTRLGLPVIDVQDPDDKRGNGFAVVLDSSGRRS